MTIAEGHMVSGKQIQKDLFARTLTSLCYLYEKDPEMLVCWVFMTDFFFKLFLIMAMIRLNRCAPLRIPLTFTQGHSGME